MLRQLRKTAGSPESGLPASNINAADGYENQLSATAEMINTSSARGTAAFTLKVNPSLFSCVNISTETSECFGNFIAPTPSFDFGSTVTSSWAVAVLRGRNEHPYRLSSLAGNPRRESYTADNDLFFYKQSRKSAGARLLRPDSPLIPRRAFYRKPTESLSAFLAEKMQEQNHRPGIQHYSLIKNNSAAAPITAKETEPSKLTTKSALTDNSLNTIRSRNSRTCLRFTTNLLVQGLGACPRRIEPCVFLPLRKLEDFISKGASASLSESILYRKTKALNPTRFSFSKEEESCA